MAARIPSRNTAFGLVMASLMAMLLSGCGGGGHSASSSSPSPSASPSASASTTESLAPKAASSSGSQAPPSQTPEPSAPTLPPSPSASAAESADPPASGVKGTQYTTGDGVVRVAYPSGWTVESLEPTENAELSTLRFRPSRGGQELVARLEVTADNPTPIAPQSPSTQSWVVVEQGASSGFPGAQWTISVQPNAVNPGMTIVGRLHMAGDPTADLVEAPGLGKFVRAAFQKHVRVTGASPSCEQLERAAAEFRASSDYARLRGYLTSVTLNQRQTDPAPRSCSGETYDYGPLNTAAGKVDCHTAKMTYDVIQAGQSQPVQGQPNTHQTSQGITCIWTAASALASHPSAPVARCARTSAPDDQFKIWRKGTMPQF